MWILSYAKPLNQLCDVLASDTLFDRNQVLSAVKFDLIEQVKSVLKSIQERGE